MECTPVPQFGQITLWEMWNPISNVTFVTKRGFPKRILYFQFVYPKTSTRFWKNLLCQLYGYKKIECILVRHKILSFVNGLNKKFHSKWTYFFGGRLRIKDAVYCVKAINFEEIGLWVYINIDSSPATWWSCWCWSILNDYLFYFIFA